MLKAVHPRCGTRHCSGESTSAAGRRSRWPRCAPSPSRYFVAFLSAAPPQAEADALTSMTFDPDQIWISGAEAFLWCPDGVAETRLSNNFLEKRLKVTATSRNWNTVLKLAELTRG